VRKIFSFVLVLLISTTAWAFDPLVMSTKIKKLLDPFKEQAGFSLRDWTGKEIADYRGRDSFPPASVAKVVSSACSFSVLSPQFQFQTIFAHTGKIANEVLTGDLVIRGAGDPSFVIEDLKEALELLYVAYGIHEIRGSLVLDLSYFGVPELEIADGFEGDQGRSFTASLTALPFNFNSFSIWIVPQNGIARVEILPKNAIKAQLINKVKVSASGVSDVSVDYRPAENKVIVSGSIPQSAENKAIYRSSPEPLQAMASQVFRIFTELGGKWVSPKMKIETSAVNAEILFRHPSKILAKQLMDINKLSTNFGAELVLLAAGAEAKGKPATFEKSHQVLQACLKDFDMAPSEITLENASGLSRKSMVQPSGLTHFLFKVLRRDFAPEYLSTLSVLGRDGTYRKRLPHFAGQARLKSGSIAGVNTLAGYVYPAGKSPMIFSLFFKCPSCSRDRLFSLEDEILALLLD
jgi:D-alanyl-D-alanine carboxypeptidase/D-alanyl-D-alanine-endopeptidase (penicillin-binding protein 4)